MPLVIVSSPWPDPWLLIQPKPISSMAAASGSGPTAAASPAPWHLPKVWPPRRQRDGFLVVHRHAREGFADVLAGRDRVRLAVGAFGVDVDQAHLHGGQGIFEVAFARIAAVGLVAGRQPFGFAEPQ